MNIAKSPNRLLGIIFGAIYIVIGLVGFFTTTGVSFFAKDGELLLGVFEINPFHNTAHLLIGILLLVAGLAGFRAAKMMNTTIGVLYLILGIIGLFVLDSTTNILALNTADNILHFVSALLLIGFGLGLEREKPLSSKVEFN